MTSTTATLIRHETSPDKGSDRGPDTGPVAAREGRLGLALTSPAGPAAPPRLPSARAAVRQAVRVAGLRAVLEVADAGARRGMGRLLSRTASDAELGREVRRALAAPGRIAEPAPRAQDLIHPGRAFCDGAWTRPRRPVRLARGPGRGPLPDRTRSVSLQGIGDAILLTPQARHGAPLALVRPALRAAAPDEELGAAVREALALSLALRR